MVVAVLGKAYEITPLPDQTIEQRRQQIKQRREKKALNPARFEKILSSLSGVEAKIVENTGKNTFQVIFTEQLTTMMKY